MKAWFPVLGEPNVYIVILVVTPRVVLMSTPANVARAPPRECPVIRNVAVGYLIIRAITAALTWDETLV